jgi:hypothetical protein
MRSTFFSPARLYTSSGVLMLLFAIAHTVGFLLYVPPAAAGQQVLELMRSVPLEDSGRPLTYYSFYRGFGVLISVFQLFGAAVAFSLASMLRQAITVPRSLRWNYAFLQLATLVISYMHFHWPPVVMSVLLTLLSFGALLRADQNALAPLPARPTAP